MVTFDWAGIPVLAKVTRCKSGTISRRYRSNGYVLNNPPPHTERSACVQHIFMARAKRNVPWRISSRLSEANPRRNAFSAKPSGEN